VRQGQHNRRGRGRNHNNNNRKPQNPLARSFESNGPEVKVRGTPAHIAEKYMALARDAQSSGDPVLAENYLQHAEHYNRIIMAYREQMQQNGEMQGGGSMPQRFRPDSLDGDELGDDETGDDASGEELPPISEGQAMPERPQRIDRPHMHQQPRDPGFEGQPRGDQRPYDNHRQFRRDRDQRFHDRDRNRQGDQRQFNDRGDRGDYRDNRDNRDNRGFDQRGDRRFDRDRDRPGQDRYQNDRPGQDRLGPDRHGGRRDRERGYQDRNAGGDRERFGDSPERPAPGSNGSGAGERPFRDRPPAVEREASAPERDFERRPEPSPAAVPAPVAPEGATPPPAKAGPGRPRRGNGERFQDEETPGFLRRATTRRGKAEAKPETSDDAGDKPSE
jgi:hypothetical protein